MSIKDAENNKHKLPAFQASGDSKLSKQIIAQLHVSGAKGYVIANLCCAYTCDKCSNKTIYYCETYDATFCATCNEWRESICNDPTCETCISRPFKPLAA